jgi:hypothetical protein
LVFQNHLTFLNIQKTHKKSLPLAVSSFGVGAFCSLKSTDRYMEKYDSGNPGLAGTQSIIEGRCCIAAKQGRSCHDALQRYSAPQHRRGTGSQGA